MARKKLGDFTCKICGKVERQKCARHVYCAVCAREQGLERERKWARDNPPSDAQVERNRSHAKERMNLVRKIGVESSADNASSIAWCADPYLQWMVRIAVPFTYAASKNSVYSTGRNGRRFLRRESVAIRDEITLRFRNALQNRRVAHTKVWIDILVQKPNHRGDAVNVVDLVCDALKVAFPVDDRWFSIRRLDWEVVKANPKLFIGIGQEHDRDQQVCSCCGIVKDLDEFYVSNHAQMGRVRSCKECLTTAGKIRRAQRKSKS